MKNKYVYCFWCGEILVTDMPNKKYCSVNCRTKHNNFIASNRGKEKLKNMKNKEKIIEIDRMAKEAGMSYGQYVGLNNL